ncbi:hypothetical protein ACHAW5_007040 [Stephanodiscus triporus]|uniref:AAA+ ATPase domain-containing protein n=1 Tax=Stephanodiscus triporus TaxID=2934178 RepID=A0ABD3P7Z4_9STRA
MASSSVAVPWVEKYRPKSLADVSHQTEIVATLANAVETNRLPHLLFYGPPGTGKTSVALALCRQLYDPSQIRRRVLELNASDERGISVVRDKIKHFASLAVGSSSSSNGGFVGRSGGGGRDFFGKKKAGERDENDENENDENDGEGKGEGYGASSRAAVVRRYPNPPFKIIILDEADTVTRDAQSALRRVIEAYSKVTRFILICNYVTRIIEPLASRCAKFRFAPLPASSMRERISHIATEEGCRFDDGRGASAKDDVIDEILRLSQGDMRRAVTTLQSAHSLSGGGGGDVIREDSIAEMAGLPPPALIDGLIDVLRDGKFDPVRVYVRDIVLEGYSAEYVLSALMAKIIALDGVSDQAKGIIAIKVAESDKNLIDGSDETLQLLAVCSIALEQFKRKNY